MATIDYEKEFPEDAKSTSPESTAMVVVGKAELVSPNDAECDDRVARILGLVRDTTRNARDIGLEIAAIQDKQLWKNRRKRGLVHRSFDEFCRSELGCSARWAQNLAKLARKHTETEFLEIGAEKLRLLDLAPEANRRDLKARAATTSAKVLRLEINAAKAKLPPPTEPIRIDTSALEEPIDPKLIAPPAPDETIFKLEIDKTFRVPLLLRSKIKGSEDVKPCPIEAIAKMLHEGRAINGRHVINKRVVLWVTLRATADGKAELLFKPIPVNREERK